MYHSLMFAPASMSTTDIITYINIERYAQDERETALAEIASGDVISDKLPQVKNTWRDWHLIPSTRPVINPPKLKKYTVDIPGGYGSLDLSETLTGHPVYENRTGSIEFIVMNNFGLIQENDTWDIVYASISNYLHGKRFKMILEDDRSYYYEGRFEVNEWRSEKDYSRIVIDYDVGPFKEPLFGTGEPWLWDTFDFETGIISVPEEITKDKAVYIFAPREYILPVITTNDDGAVMRVAKMYDYPFSGKNREKWLDSLPETLNDVLSYKDYTLRRGANTFPDLEIGGNYIYGFQFSISGGIEVNFPYVESWTHTFTYGGVTYITGEYLGNGQLNIPDSGDITLFINIDNTNIIPSGCRYHDEHEDGAFIDIIINGESWVTEGYLNNGMNVLSGISIPSGGALIEFKFVVRSSNRNAKAAISTDGQTVSISYKGGEL